MLKKFMNLFDADKDEAKKNTQSAAVATTKHNSDDDDDDDEDYDDDDDDDEDEEEEWPEEEKGQRSDVELDPVTLHGKNYTEAQFDAEVEKRVQGHLKDAKEEGEELEKEDVDNYYYNIRREVYQEWTGANHNQAEQWFEANSMKYRGHAAYGSTKHDNNNPLLQPIHGVSLQDYGAMSYYLSTGSDYNAILAQLGVDAAVWQEATLLWDKRMAEDTTFSVTVLFGQYYSTADQHPKLSAVAVELSPKGKETIAKMKADRLFYIEVAAAATAAFEYGIDGSQWLVDNYEITNGDLQKIAAHYGQLDNQHVDLQAQKKYGDLMFAKMDEYKKKFAADQGGNVADDINF